MSAVTLHQWIPGSTPLARHIVREILRRENKPLHNHSIWEKCQEYQLGPEEQDLHQRDLDKFAPRYKIPNGVERKVPPRPDHPIRSLSYLKQYVLHDLQERGEIVKKLTLRPPTEEEKWAIVSAPPKTRRARKRRGAAPPGRQPPVLNAEGLVFEWAWVLADEVHAQKKAKLFQEKIKTMETQYEKLKNILPSTQNPAVARKIDYKMQRLGKTLHGTSRFEHPPEIRKDRSRPPPKTDEGPFGLIRRAKAGQDDNGFLSQGRAKETISHNHMTQGKVKKSFQS